MVHNDEADGTPKALARSERSSAAVDARSADGVGLICDRITASNKRQSVVWAAMLRCANGRSLPQGGAVVWDGESGIEVEVAANCMFDRLRNNTLGHLFTLTRAAPYWPGSPTATKPSRWSGQGSVPTWLLPVSTAKPPPDGQLPPHL